MNKETKQCSKPCVLFISDNQTDVAQIQIGIRKLPHVLVWF